MNNLKYILINKNPVIEPNLLKWADWFEITENRIVSKNNVKNIMVSTVFLGLDHNFDEGEPLLFETMIFGSRKYKNYQERYATWEEAEKGHQRALDLVKLKQWKKNK